MQSRHLLRRATPAVIIIAATFTWTLGVGAARVRPMRVVFPEGWSVRQMVDRVAAVRLIAIKNDHVTPVLTGHAYAQAVTSAKPPQAFVAADTRGSLEGFLFPATYFFDASTPATQIVDEQISTFETRWATVVFSPRAKALSGYAVLTIASLVQREASVDAERPLIAAVIYNRLENGMPLGIDATLRYGLGIQGTRPLTAAQIHSDSPYNTDLVTGLPPTPIANPGIAAVRAAANPANTAALYYVRIPGSTHHFFTASETTFCARLVQWGYHPC
jgi:uncharacterized YceG family protein